MAIGSPSQNYRPPNLSRITYTALENGIHEVTFTDTSHQAVDEWAVNQLWLDRVIPADETIFELIDATAGVPSMAYVIRTARVTIAQHSKGRKYYTAVLYPNNQRVYASLFISLINGLRTRNVHLRLLPADQRQDAVNWLLDHKLKLTSATPDSVAG